MAFLPEGYEVPSGNGGKYFKPQQGDNKVRILDSPILGNVGWIEKDGKKSPVRVRQGERLPADCDSGRHFWALKVYDYAAGSVKVWEITQVRIQESLRQLAQDPDWGSPVGYDVKIGRKGEGLETEYTVTPQPPSEMPEDVRKADLTTGVDLEKLYEGGDPFDAAPGAEVEEEDEVPF